jgi:nitroreductase/FMN reductase [NAD(P)H]
VETPEQRIHLALKRRFGASLPVPDGLGHAAALAAMNERSVCRSYREQPVAAELVALLCATALSAPSKSDLQQADLIRVCAPEKRAAIHALLPGSPWIAGAPEFLVVCGDHRRVRHLFAARGREFPNDHLDSFFNAALDAGIVLATFVQAAHLAGLGTCPISEVRNHAAAIAALLELPQWVFPVAGLCVGHPHALEPLSPRLGLGATVHVDGYDAGRMDAELAEYDARRVRERPYRRQRDPARFGAAPAYGWSEDKFRQYSEVQRADFGAFVRGRGFRLD